MKEKKKLKSGTSKLVKYKNEQKYLTCSSVCWPRSVVDIITPAAKEPSSRLKPSLSLHWNDIKMHVLYSYLLGGIR